MAGFIDSEAGLKRREKDCIDFLKSRGYTIYGPLATTHICKNTKDLVRFFYVLMSKCNPGRNIQFVAPTKTDIKYASALVKLRKKYGSCSDEKALIEAQAIISALLKNEALLNLKAPIYSISDIFRFRLLKEGTILVNEENSISTDVFTKEIDTYLNSEDYNNLFESDKGYKK